MKLYSTDFVVITEDNTPLRYSSGEIGLWAEENLDEITLEENEKFLTSDKLQEPFKTELINQIKKYK
jgi:hypothetical protein